MQKYLAFILILAALGLFWSHPAKAAVLTVDTVWQNEVTLSEDVLVPAGVTLTLRPGTVVRVVAAESTKTDPEFISPLTEITVRGRLKIEGTPINPVKLISQDGKNSGEWAGVLIDGGIRSEGATVVAFLRAQGIDDIDVMVASHADADHIGGLIDVLALNDIPVRAVVFNGYTGTTGTWITFVTAVAAEGRLERFAVGLGAGAESYDLRDGFGYSSTLTEPTVSLRLGGTINQHWRLGGEALVWFRDVNGGTESLSSFLLIGQAEINVDRRNFVVSGDFRKCLPHESNQTLPLVRGARKKSTAGHRGKRHSHQQLRIILNTQTMSGIRPFIVENKLAHAVQLQIHRTSANDFTATFGH